MTDIGVLARKTLVQQPPESPGAIPVRIPVQIIPTHLVHDNADNKLGPRNSLSCRRQFRPRNRLISRRRLGPAGRLTHRHQRCGRKEQGSDQSISHADKKILSAEGKQNAVKKDRRYTVGQFSLLSIYEPSLSCYPVVIGHHFLHRSRTRVARQLDLPLQREEPQGLGHLSERYRPQFRPPTRLLRGPRR